MRLFLAVELPVELRLGVAALLADLAPRTTGWRWLRSESIHLTLRFFGEIDPVRERRSRGGWARVAAKTEPFRLRLTELGRFPPRGDPRVLWVGVAETRPGGVLERLAQGVELTAWEQGWEPERRPFRPHLTLARREPTGRPAVPAESKTLPRAEGPVRCITLVESHLEPAGARYTLRASFPLGGEGATDG